MSDIEEPGYAERDDDETSEQTGGGIGFDEPDEGDEADDDGDDGDAQDDDAA
jgi:hypothetical protein